MEDTRDNINTKKALYAAFRLRYPDRLDRDIFNLVTQTLSRRRAGLTLGSAIESVIDSMGQQQPPRTRWERLAEDS